MIDKKRVYELVEKAVTDDVMELCSHNARAEVIGRVSMDAFGFNAFGEDISSEQYDMLNLLDDMVIDVMARRGYILEEGELASRTIECFEHFHPVQYVYHYNEHLRGGPLRYVYVRPSRLHDGVWLAQEHVGFMAEVTWEGYGITPQQALDNMRMIHDWE